MPVRVCTAAPIYDPIPAFPMQRQSTGFADDARRMQRLKTGSRCRKTRERWGTRFRGGIPLFLLGFACSTEYTVHRVQNICYREQDVYIYSSSIAVGGAYFLLLRYSSRTGTYRRATALGPARHLLSRCP